MRWTMSSNNDVELIATASFGLEAVIARELKDLGYERQSVADGRVTFVAEEPAVCRTNLWLRSADRVLLKVGSSRRGISASFSTGQPPSIGRNGFRPTDSSL